MAEAASLSGRRVLLTREPERARAWAAALEGRGAVAEPREVFRLEALSGAGTRAALASVERYRWILLTSVNGLRFFVEALASCGRAPAELAAAFAVVGPRTRSALEAYGVTPRVVAARADSTGLAESLSGLIGKGDRVLVVRPEVSRPELAEALVELGADVDSVPFYRNHPAHDVGGVARDLVGGRYDAAVFGSPSAFEHLRAAAGPDAGRLERTALVAIGATTAGAIRAAGYRVAATARVPTAEGIADAVEEALVR